MPSRKRSIRKVCLFFLLAVLLSFSTVTAFAAGMGDGSYTENEYARAEWQTSLSKTELLPGEDLYSTIDLSITIKKVPEEYRDLIEELSGIKVTAVIYYGVARLV
ncbi:MAG: hypothetical protein ACOC6S_02585 [Chloroflexota bacterium]